MNSILLHAAARGARLQMYSAVIGEWINVIDRPKVNDRYTWRIHPDDELLRYGPISRRLRIAAEKPPIAIDSAFPICTHFTVMAKYSDFLAWPRIPPETRQWFLLMLAEELAHDGL